MKFLAALFLILNFSFSWAYADKPLVGCTLLDPAPQYTTKFVIYNTNMHNPLYCGTEEQPTCYIEFTEYPRAGKKNVLERFDDVHRAEFSNQGPIHIATAEKTESGEPLFKATLYYQNYEGYSPRVIQYRDILYSVGNCRGY